MKNLQVYLCVGAVLAALACGIDLPDQNLSDLTIASRTHEFAKNRKSRLCEASKATAKTLTKISTLKTGTTNAETQIEEYNRSIALTAETLGCLQRGNDRLHKGDASAAIECYSQAIELNPRYASAFDNRGAARECVGDRKGAERDYKTAIVLNPDFASARKSLAIMKIEDNDLSGAITELTLSIQMAPDSEALNDLGCILERVGDPEGALNNFTKAIELNPTDAFAYKHRAQISGATGNYDEAIRDYDRVILLKPNDAAAFWQRGYTRNNAALAKPSQTTLNKKMARKLAIQDFSRAIEIAPTFIRAYQERAFARSGIGDHMGAVDDFTQVIRLDPNPAMNYQSRSLMRKWCGDVRGAIADLDQAILRNTIAPFDAYSDRAILRTKTGDYRGALQDYLKACKINPQSGFVKLSDWCMDSIVAAFADVTPKASKQMFFHQVLRSSGDWDALLSTRR